jgi:mersacidin/lichenicidin family type 2 lantibiotic
MSNKDIIRAWKDEAYRANLEENKLPENPAGEIELNDEALREAQGGSWAPCGVAETWWVICNLENV